MTKLYKRDKKGKLMEWNIWHDGVSYTTSSGYYEGKMTKYKCEKKNSRRIYQRM